MTTKTKILIGVLVIVFLIVGWFIFIHPRFCLTDKMCKFGRCEHRCVNKYSILCGHCVIRPTLWNLYVWDNMSCRCINNKCIDDKKTFCQKACQDISISEREIGIIAHQTFLEMDCEKEVDCEYIKKEVTIATDKTEYEQEEIIKITIKNDLDKSIWYPSSPYVRNLGLLGYDEKTKWGLVPLLPSIPPPPEGWPFEIKELKKDEVLILEYRPLDWHHSVALNFIKYKISFEYRENKEEGEYKKIYSNEFAIKEKKEGETVLSPDGLLHAQIIPVGKTRESIIRIWTKEGKLLQEADYTSEDGDHGLVVSYTSWTPDSEFFIYSTYSSGGHQPWFSPVYFYSRANNKIYHFSAVSGFTVARDEFAVAAPDIVTFTVYTSSGMGPTTTKSFKLSEIISTLAWKTYRNEEYGLEFEYPKEWISITLESQKDNQVYQFSSPNEEIETILYHKPSGIIAFITRGEKYKLEFDGENYQDILKAISDKKIKTIYTVSPEMVEWYGRIGRLNISPNGKYISFILSGFEYSKPFMINIQTSQNIFEGLEIWFDDPEESIYWSSNNQVLAIKSEMNDMAGFGICGIFISDYGNPEKLNEIFSVPVKKHIFQGIHVSKVQFIDNERLFFEIGEGIEKYIYNAKTKELEKIK